MTDSSYIARACVGVVAGLDHERREDVGPDDRDADREDDQPDRRRGERRERDADRDPATHQRPAGSTPGRPIADAADRGDVARRLGVVAELVAEPADVDVDGAVQDLGLVGAVDRVEQLVAAEDPAVGLEDRLEQPELDVGQGDRPAGAGDLVPVAVERQVAVDDAAARVGRRGHRRCGAPRRIDFTRRTSSAGENGLGR